MSERLRFPLKNLSDSSLDAQAFYKAAAKAVPKLRALKSGLPDDRAPCVSLFGGEPPDWKLPIMAGLLTIAVV